MARSNPIPIPHSIRLKRFCARVLPILTFFGCVVLTGWLWRQSVQVAHGVAAVEAVRIDVASRVDGLVAPISELPAGQWTLFDRVESGTVLARLDDAPLLASVATLRAELAQLSAEVLAERARLSLDHQARSLDDKQQRVQLAWQVERARLGIAARQVELAVDRVEKDRLEAQLGFMEPLLARSAITEQELIDMRLQLTRVESRIEANEQAITEQESQRDAAETRISQLPPPTSGDVEAIVAPFRAAMDVQEARIQEVLLQVDGLWVRAPITGVIVAMHVYPGQTVLAGDPLVSVASEHGRYALAYVRQEQRITPRAGMEVVVRPRFSTLSPASTVIARVGPQIELVPPSQLRDPATPEWGRPVLIALPRDLELQPGTLLDVTYLPNRGGGI